jgi:glutaconate CoA-transferase subunit B
VVTDLGILEPDPATCELVVTHIHPGSSMDDIRAATAWALKISPGVRTTDPPTDAELTALHSLRYADEEWAGLSAGTTA